jgi:hypothetical protein
LLGSFAITFSKPVLTDRNSTNGPRCASPYACTTCGRRFVTIALANGKTETWIADRTGHRSRLMINTYRRQARHAAELGLGGMLPLCDAIPELARATRGAPEGGGSRPSASRRDASKRDRKRDQITRTSGGIGIRTGFRFRRREAWGFESLLVHEVNQSATMISSGRRMKDRDLA